MCAFQVLLVEDNPTWQTILKTYIQTALPNSDVEIAASFQEAVNALSQRKWDLLVTDIGLPPDSGYVLGIQLANQARLGAVPCIVVSGSESVTKQHVRDLFRDYQVRDFFSKEELESRPDKQIAFQELVKECATLVSATAVEEKLNLGRTSTREVTIGIRSESLYVTSNGLRTLVIPSGLPKKIFILFAHNVSEGLPAKAVKNTVLNEIVGMPADETASPLLRRTIKELNDGFRDWAHLHNIRWIIGGRAEHGYCLNSQDVQWNIEKELRKHLQSGKTLWDVLVDPRKMAANTPDREHRLPTRPRGKQHAAEDEDR